MATLALGATALCAFPVLAEQGERSDRGPWWQNEQKVAKLGLSDDQVKGIGEIDAKYSQPLKDVRRGRISAYRSLLRLLDKPDYTPEEFDELTTRLETAFAAEARLTAEHWAELRKVLSEEQWQKLGMVAPGELMVGGFAISARGKVIIGDPGMDGSASATGPAAKTRVPKKPN